MCDQTKWGPSTWQYLHAITLAYPITPNTKHKEAIKTEFENLQYILPCSVCQTHFHENLSLMPLTDDILSTRIKLVTWLITLHNKVNVMLGKKERNVQKMILYHELLSGCVLSDESLQLKKKIIDKIKSCKTFSSQFNDDSVGENFLSDDIIIKLIE